MEKGFIQIIDEFKKPGMVVAEVGTWVGDSTKFAAPIVKGMKGRYLAIDWFKGSINTVPAYSSDTYDTALEEFKANIKLVGCGKFVEILDMTTQEALNVIEDQSLDICFIDADHRYEEVKQDIISYFPKVKIGGVICGHDLEPFAKNLFNTFTPEQLKQDCIAMKYGEVITHIHPGVIQAVGELFGFDAIKSYSDNVWFTRRIK